MEIFELENKLAVINSIREREMIELIKGNDSLVQNILSKIDLIELPKSQANTSTVLTGKSAQDFYVKTDSFDKSRFKFYSGNLAGEWVLKIDSYAYHSKGPLDIPYEGVSKSMYFRFNETVFLKVEKLLNDNLLIWIQIKEISNDF
jgi:hypothetical protein